MRKHHVVIAGGAINAVFSNRPINDIDIYFQTIEDFHNFMNDIIDDELVKFSYISKKSITMVQTKECVSQYKLQAVICDWYGEIEDIFNSFDFTCCMGAYDIHSGCIIAHEDFLTDIASRTLRVNTGTKFPFQSVNRILKYKEYGYTINRLDLFKLLFAISFNNKTENWADVMHTLDGYYTESGEEMITIDHPDTECSLENVVKFLNEAAENIRPVNSENWYGQLKTKDMHKIVNNIKE